MRRAYREPLFRWARALAGLALAAGLAGCGGASAGSTVEPEDVEIALYVAIQDEDPRIVVTGPIDVASLRRLYDIACREAALRTWACDVLLDDESRVACTVDRVRGDDARIDGRVHCKS